MARLPKTLFPHPQSSLYFWSPIQPMCVCVCVCVCCSCSVVSDSLWPHGLWLIRLLCPWSSSPAEKTGLACHSLFQRSFPTQRLWERLSPALWADSLLSESLGKLHSANVLCEDYFIISLSSGFFFLTCSQILYCLLSLFFLLLFFHDF